MQTPSRPSGSAAAGQGGNASVKDSLIASIPGIYAPSGFGIIDILLQVYQRPNPQIKIGNVDSSVALVLCDADVPDNPIVYCSEPFEQLTGYNSTEILGHNCRFLQHPPSSPTSHGKVHEPNELARKQVRGKVESGEEVGAHFVNFRRDGTLFTNILTFGSYQLGWEELYCGVSGRRGKSLSVDTRESAWMRKRREELPFLNTESDNNRRFGVLHEGSLEDLLVY
ncbi:hypothetical protein BKA65DRAFT_473262 [Rhexocercosporidium sp. MPI-PUGE-AT-0058]|nr:hypothetical protein BKA65DRAFT_473262 [Rhexocercosporidium sp. MPI-PUGE-AT-0058]